MIEYVTKAGTYVCNVKEPGNGWFGEAGEKNTPFIRIPCVVKEGEQVGREIVWRGWLTDNSIDRTTETLAKAFGWDGNLEALASGRCNDVFAGKECEIVAESEDYNGKTRVKASWLNPVGGDPIKAIDTKTLDGLIKKLQRRCMAVAKGSAAKKAIEPKNPQTEEVDDIPF